MARFSKLWKKHKPLVAFVLLVIAIMVGFSAQARQSAKQSARSAAVVVYHSQFKSCLRGNMLRMELNRRVRDFNEEKSVIVAFLDSAEHARLANWKATHMRSDLTAATAYHRDKARMNALKYNRLPYVNCTVAIAKP